MRTAKQWHAEILREKIKLMDNLVQGSLGELNSTFPKAPTGKELLQTLSSEQSALLQHVEALYGSDTRRTAERMLSEYTEMASRTPSILERARSARDILSASSKRGDLKQLDAFTEMRLYAALINTAWAGRMKFVASHGRGGEIVLRARLLDKSFSDSDEKG